MLRVKKFMKVNRGDLRCVISYVRRVGGEDRDAEFWEQEGEGRHWHSSIVVC